MNTTFVDSAYSFLEVVNHLQVPPDTVRAWTRRFAQFLGAESTGDSPRYSMADVGMLLSVQKLLEQGFSDEQVSQRLTPKRIQVEAVEQTALSPQHARQLVSDEGGTLTNAVGDLLSTIATSQQTVLNSQNTVREMVNVVVQDNFNLKEENRKIRERILEMERDLAEYQRKEETRRERTESRLRALEGTVWALQQQVAQLVQVQRQQLPPQQRKRGWW